MGTKTKATHTPGPWEVIDGFDFVVVGTVETKVALCTMYDDDAALADARLMAAAPDLLGMLEEILGCCELNLDEMEPETHEVIGRATALLERINNEAPANQP